MKKALRRLDSVHERLINTISPLDAKLYAQQPAQGKWSVAEVVHHLCLVEDRVTKDLERALSGAPESVGLFRRLIPTSIVASRLIRVKAPGGVNPSAAPEKETAIENFNRARQALKTLCTSHNADRFRRIIFKHPFLGKIDGVAAVSFVGYHEKRHYKQILEVLRKLDGNAGRN